MRGLDAVAISFCCVIAARAACPTQHMVRVPIGGSLESFHPPKLAAPTRNGARVVFSTSRRLLPADLGMNDGDIYLFDATNGTLTLESEVGGTVGCGDPRISADGAQLLFSARPGYPAPQSVPSSAVFAKRAGETAVVEVSENATADYALYTSLSPDGEWAVYAEVDSPMTGGLASTPMPFTVFAESIVTGESIVIAPPPSALYSAPSYESPTTSVSNHADVVVFSTSRPDLVPGDTNQATDVFVYRRALQQLVRVTAPNGEQLNASSYDGRVSADGRFVVFTSSASNTGIPGLFIEHLHQIYVHSIETGALERVSVNSSERAATDSCYSPSISGDGRYVCFSSIAPNLSGGASANGAVQVYVRDRLLGITRAVSSSASGELANRNCVDPEISIDGAAVAFMSEASNLVPGDTTNPSADLFVRYLPAELAFTAEPLSQSAFVGETVQLRCEVRARESVAYQWYRGAVALEESERVRGVNTNVLEIDSLACADAGDHRVFVTDACNQTIASVQAALIVGPPGDSNGDGRVQLFDLATLLTHFGATSATRAMGDANGDATVDLADLALLLTHFGNACD